MRAQDENRGYTLVEMVVVLAIFGIMLAVAVPSMSRGNSWRRVDAAGRDLASRIQLAREMAVLRRAPYRMTLDRYGRSYYFERQENDSTWARDPDQTYALEGVSEVASDIGGSSSDDQVVFETRGTIPEGDSPAEIHLLNEHGDDCAVLLVRTGRVTARTTRGSS